VNSIPNDLFNVRSILAPMNRSFHTLSRPISEALPEKMACLLSLQPAFQTSSAKKLSF